MPFQLVAPPKLDQLFLQSATYSKNAKIQMSMETCKVMLVSKEAGEKRELSLDRKE
jgi:hypothetical protein